MEAGGFSWQPREIGGWGFENLQVSVGDGHQCRTLSCQVVNAWISCLPVMCTL